MTTIDEIRRVNLRHLLQRYNTNTEFARKIGTNPAYITHILSDVTRANMGDDLARRCEEAHGLETGWMDVQHDTASRSSGRFKRIPLLELDQARRWRGIVHAKNEDQQYLSVAIEGNGGADKHAYRWEGSAMEPDLPRECIVIVDPDEAPTHGCLVVASLKDKRVVVRQLRMEEGQEVLAASDARFPMIPRSYAVELLTITDYMRSVRPARAPAG